VLIPVKSNQEQLSIQRESQQYRPGAINSGGLGRYCLAAFCNDSQHGTSEVFLLSLFRPRPLPVSTALYGLLSLLFLQNHVDANMRDFADPSGDPTYHYCGLCGHRSRALTQHLRPDRLTAMILFLFYDLARSLFILRSTT
jgi:hypothetical protein